MLWLVVAASAGTLELHVAPKDAAVTVDGEARGAGPLTLTVPDGAHRVRVTRDAFDPWEQVVTVLPAGTCVAITLQRTPPPFDADAARAKKAREDLLWTAVEHTADPTGVRHQPRDQAPELHTPDTATTTPPPAAGPPPWEVAEPCPAPFPPPPGQTGPPSG